MIKISKTSEKISPFGGINFVIDELENAGIPNLINSAFPKQHGRAKYSYADNILSMVYGVFCGAERLEDMTTLKPRLHNSCLNIPNPTTIGRVLRHKLPTSNQTIGNHNININERLNALMLDIAVKLGLLESDKHYTLDYDNTCIPCEKEDSDWTYKKFRGYQPGISFIGTIPVWVEGMNGNNPAAFDQVSTLKRTLSNLKNYGVSVSLFRADAASYQYDVLDLMQGNDIEIFVRAESSLNLFEDMLTAMPKWETVTLGLVDTFEVCEFEYVPFKRKNKDKVSYRIVMSRRPSIDGKPHKITGRSFNYRSIITDNRTLSNEDVVWTYNQRGAIERNFDVLNNDWNWNKLPFSYMAENTVFMLITAMGWVMFQHVLARFAKRSDFVKDTHRMKGFHYNVIAVAAQWEGDTLMIHDKSRPWEQLIA